MAVCRCGRVIAHPAPDSFCSPQVKLAMPSREFRSWLMVSAPAGTSLCDSVRPFGARFGRGRDESLSHRPVWQHWRDRAAISRRPPPKEVLMRVRASSLNYRDLMVLKGGGRGPAKG
jgi:hypothetical protein